MPGINAKSTPIIPRNRPYPPDGREAARAIRALRIPGSEQIARGFEVVTDSLNSLHQAARQNAPEIDEFLVTDESTGRVLAALGNYERNGIVYGGGYFAELHAGDPYGDSDPAHAIFNVTPDGAVTVGQNGWIDVLDPFGEDAAWIGTQADTLPVTGAADNGGGIIRLTVVGHTLATGDAPAVLNVGGVPNATGIWTITKVDADHIDLDGVPFDGAYTSGGTINRLLHITGAANNGAGLIRITTAVAHTYESGDKVNIQSVGGVTAANGQWIVTVIDTTHFDLVDSTFSGAYTSGGICLRYFAGMLAQTFAIGDSFADYKLRAFADGRLAINDATITLNGSGATIVLDPDDGSVTVTQVLPGTQQIVLDSDGVIYVKDVNDATHDVEIASRVIVANSDTSENYYTVVGYSGIGLTKGLFVAEGSSGVSLGDARVLWGNGFSGANSNGMTIFLSQARGTGSSPSATQSGDTLGAILGGGHNGTAFEDYSAGVSLEATEAHTSTAHGAKVVLRATPNGSTSPTRLATFDQDGTLNVPVAFKVAGSQVVSTRKLKPTQTTKTAGAAYTANEQAMLNELKTWQDQVNAALSAAAGGHGIWA